MERQNAPDAQSAQDDVMLHPANWTPAAIARFWDYLSRHGSGSYFS